MKYLRMRISTLRSEASRPFSLNFVKWLSATLLGCALLFGSTLARADDPKPDPAGTATGTISDVPGFIVSAPTDLSADDAKDAGKAKAYADAKKAADDYAAEAKIEPLAVKLADNVGHNRVAINFMWTLVTGFLFSEEIFGRPLTFTHKNVFSVAGWLTFAVLLIGRWRYGWRGRRALRWILAGTLLLVLGYLGSKFVTEVLLRR